MLVIGDRFTVSMFKLLGINGVAIEDTDPRKVREVIELYVQSGDYYVIYITKDLADLVRDYIERISATRRWPVVTVIPSRWSEIEEIDASAILRKALGVG